MRPTLRDIFFLGVGGLIFSALCFFADFNIFGGVHAQDTIHSWDSVYFRDSIVSVILRRDTIKVPGVERKQVVAMPLDPTKCPRIEYRSETIRDTIHIIADCESRTFPLIDVRLTPIEVFRTDTVMRISVREVVREKEVIVNERRKWLLISAYGEFADLLSGFDEWAIGIRAKITLGNLGLYIDPHFEHEVKIALGGEVNILEE